MSYQEVLRTNGQISFPEVLRQQKRLRVYREKQLAGPKTCTLPSKKSALYCTWYPARIRLTIICQNSGSSARNTGCLEFRERTRCGFLHPAMLHGLYVLYHSSILLLQIQTRSGLNILCCLFSGAATRKVDICFLTENLRQRCVQPFQNRNRIQ